MESLEIIIGKRIKGVVVKEGKEEPKKQIFLLFSDNTFYEIYGDYCEGSSCLNRGGLESVRDLGDRRDQQVTFEQVDKRITGEEASKAGGKSMNAYQRVTLVLGAIALLLVVATAPKIQFGPKGTVWRGGDLDYLADVVDWRTALTRILGTLIITGLMFWALTGTRRGKESREMVRPTKWSGWKISERIRLDCPNEKCKWERTDIQIDDEIERCPKCGGELDTTLVFGGARIRYKRSMDRFVILPGYEGPESDGVLIDQADCPSSIKFMMDRYRFDGWGDRIRKQMGFML